VCGIITSVSRRTLCQARIFPADLRDAGWALIYIMFTLGPRRATTTRRRDQCTASLSHQRDIFMGSVPIFGQRVRRLSTSRWRSDAQLSRALLAATTLRPRFWELCDVSALISLSPSISLLAIQHLDKTPRKSANCSKRTESLGFKSIVLRMIAPIELVIANFTRDFAPAASRLLLHLYANRR